MARWGERKKRRWMEKYKGEYESTVKATREQPKAEETEELCSYSFSKFSEKKKEGGRK